MWGEAATRISTCPGAGEVGALTPGLTPDQPRSSVAMGGLPMMCLPLCEHVPTFGANVLTA